ncbi:MAG TPA: SRPBCC family protein [Burkholderiales bacterium]|nr:SRPBCC family protein [Burkholderiales bacterium]
MKTRMTTGVGDDAASTLYGDVSQAHRQTRVWVTRRFRESPERVFDAWLDPYTAGHWLFATAPRPMLVVSIDARAGGAFRFARRADGGATYVGHYLEVIRPRRLVFTVSGVQRAHDVARVCVEIVPLKSGCELRLMQDNVPLNDTDHTEGRWDGQLYGLAAMLDKS